MIGSHNRTILVRERIGPALVWLLILLTIGFGYFLVRPAAAVSSARPAYYVAATDCFEARSAMLELDGVDLPTGDRQSAYRASLVPAMGCLEKTRIEEWLRLQGVAETEISLIRLESLQRALVTTEYLSTQITAP